MAGLNFLTDPSIAGIPSIDMFFKKENMDRGAAFPNKKQLKYSQDEYMAVTIWETADRKPTEVPYVIIYPLKRMTREMRWMLDEDNFSYEIPQVAFVDDIQNQDVDYQVIYLLNKYIGDPDMFRRNVVSYGSAVEQNMDDIDDYYLSEDDSYDLSDE